MQGLEGCAIADIAGCSQRAAVESLDLRGRLFYFRQSARRGDDVGASIGEPEGDGVAQTGDAADDHCDSARQIEQGWRHKDDSPTCR